jgi:hypothetical protein
MRQLAFLICEMFIKDVSDFFKLSKAKNDSDIHKFLKAGFDNEKSLSGIQIVGVLEDLVQNIATALFIQEQGNGNIKTVMGAISS